MTSEISRTTRRFASSSSSSSNNYRASRVRRVSTRSLQDTSGRGQVLIDSRESHTADLESYDRYMILLKEAHPTLEPKVWTFLRKLLEQHGGSTGFEPNDDEFFVPKTQEESNRFMSKVKGLDPINPINPKKISKLLPETSLETILTDLLFATQVGLTTLRFAPQCKRCGGQCLQTPNLCSFDKKCSISCSMCGADNNVHSLDAIGAYFFFHPSVLYILATNWGCYPSSESFSKRIVKCAAVPANDLRMGIRYSIGCKQQRNNIFDEPLPVGEYRGRCGISGASYILRVEGEADDDDDHAHECTIQVSQLIPAKNKNNVDNNYNNNNKKSSDTIVSVPHGRLKLDIQPDTDSLFCFILHQPNTSEETVFNLPPQEQHVYTSAADILHHPLQQQQITLSSLSLDSILKLGGELDTGQVTLVFTDVVQSTDMYRRLGDWKALELVQAHFQILFQAFSTWGRVVKTVGDAVMASFASPAAAMRASADALLGLQEQQEQEMNVIQIRIGIHSGPALVVPVNGINDYFGQTVNRAARLEGRAPPGGCLITKEVMDEDVLEEILSSEAFVKVEAQSLDLKGIGEATQAVGFQLKKNKKI
mmetsp:Transcript_10608/g.15611  ORF Transcript_10608/g.15611 Transcript_10608/m.15611 type:complete len:593 (-) Transcript_10608:133-1911(-)